MSSICAQAAQVEPRKSLGYKWGNKFDTVRFYCNVSSSWKPAIQSAMSTWNAVKDSTTGKSIVTMTTTNTPDTYGNVIYSQSLGKGVIAQAYPSYSSSGNLQKVDIAFNSGMSFSIGASSGKYDVQTVILHELGHSMGIVHCHETGESCFSSTCSSNAMNPVVGTNMTRRSLTSYDTSSKQNIYW